MMDQFDDDFDTPGVEDYSEDAAGEDSGGVVDKAKALFDRAGQWAVERPVQALIAFAVVVALVAGVVLWAMSGTSDEDLDHPRLDVQGDNGSSVVTGGGDANEDVLKDRAKGDDPKESAFEFDAEGLPEPPPPPVYIPPKEAAPKELPKVTPPPEVVDPKGAEKGGQVRVPRFIPGEDAAKVDTRPRPQPKPQDKPKPKPAPKPKPGQGGRQDTPAARGAKPKPPAAPVRQPELANTLEAKGHRAPVVPSGHDKENASFLPPENPALVGWYQNSAEPGKNQPGSVVMSSHINNNGVDGVGMILSSLNPGDIVTTWNMEGLRSRWRVTKKINVNKESDMAGMVNRFDGPQTLVLVTCGGPYIGPPLYYADNVVLEAVPA